MIETKKDLELSAAVEPKVRRSLPTQSSQAVVYCDKGRIH